jgi:hypothetical protein
MITEITILAEEDEILDTAAFPYFPVSGPPQNTAETLLDGRLHCSALSDFKMAARNARLNLVLAGERDPGGIEPI